MSTETVADAVVANLAGRPANMPWVTPYLMVQDVRAAVAFYERAFGFVVRNIHDGPDGQAMHASVEWRDGVVMMGIEGGYGGTTMSPATSGSACPISPYVYCEDVDALVSHAEAAGARKQFPPMDTFWGDRICNLVDPNGYVWCFATYKGVPADPAQN